MTKRSLYIAAIMITAAATSSFMSARGGSPGSSKPAPITYYKDVAPILQDNCVTCHRAGEVAPMSLRTYEETRPWAQAIKRAVVAKMMPPWFGDPRYGHFSNERKLTPEQIRTLVVWADSGAVEGDKKDAPLPLEFVDGWSIGKPDLILEMEEFHVPAEGVIPYQSVVIPGNFKEDVWVQAAEIRPGNRALVHHAGAFIRPPGTKWLQKAKPGVAAAMDTPSTPDFVVEAAKNGESKPVSPLLGAEDLVGYAPGLQPFMMKDTGILIRAGSDIVLQLHYTPNGHAGTDKTRVGLVFRKTPPQYTQMGLGAENIKFAIPPNDNNYEIRSAVELQQDLTLLWLMPHMHYRGKDFVFRAILPSGETKTLLSVPRYSFHWQLSYQLEEPITLPKGTRIECTAHYDNSVNNPDNPDPAAEVHYGEQTWEEMMIGFFYVRLPVDAKVTRRQLVKWLPGEAKSSLPSAPNSAPQTDPKPGANNPSR